MRIGSNDPSLYRPMSYANEAQNHSSALLIFGANPTVSGSLGANTYTVRIETKYNAFVIIHPDVEFNITSTNGMFIRKNWEYTLKCAPGEFVHIIEADTTGPGAKEAYISELTQ